MKRPLHHQTISFRKIVGPLLFPALFAARCRIKRMSQEHHPENQQSLQKRVLQEASLAVLAQRALVEKDVSSLLRPSIITQ
jgi:hypothetical protein